MSKGPRGSGVVLTTEVREERERLEAVAGHESSGLEQRLSWRPRRRPRSFAGSFHTLILTARAQFEALLRNNPTQEYGTPT
jgi:hypothetical protein